jgi:hypothetical protein
MPADQDNKRRSAMPTYLLTHHFPKNFQGSPETAAAAQAWFARLGRTAAGPGNQAPEPVRLGNCETDAEPRLAYTLISTDALEAALAMAEAWPLLARGGGVEVREVTILKPGVQASA